MVDDCYNRILYKLAQERSSAPPPRALLALQPVVEGRAARVPELADATRRAIHAALPTYKVARVRPRADRAAGRPGGGRPHERDRGARRQTRRAAWEAHPVEVKRVNR